LKKLLFFWIMTVCAFNGFSLEKDTAVCEIYLIRHARVELKKPLLCTSSKAAELLDQYDDLPVLDFDPTPVKALLGDSVRAVFTSVLPRSVETAGILFPETDTLYSNSIFNEYDLSMISVPLIPLPYVAWTTLSRFFWTIGLNNQDESRIRAYKRMLEATDLIEKQAIGHGQIVLVAHGYLISEMKRELKKRGWKLEIDQGHQNLAVAKLTKTTLSSH
jgi:broad specificity phosphatase PhoE